MADKKKKKKEKTFEDILGSRPAEPQPRSLNDELGQLIPKLGELGSMSSEQYIASQKELTQFQYDFFKQHYAELAGMEREEQSKATARARNDALAYLGEKGPAARTAARTANPEWAAASDKLTQMVGQAGTRSPFAAELDRQAMEELKLGGALTPEEERASQQSARSAFAARGQALGGSSAVAEVLNRDSMSRARLRERQLIGAGREQVFEAQRGAERQFVTGATQLTEAQAPIWKILGQQGQATSPSSLLGFTQGVRTPDPSSIYGAGLNYGADLFNTNLNMQASMYNSYQNNLAALTGAQMQSEAQIAAAQAQAGAYNSGGGSGMMSGLLGGLGTGVATGAGLAAAGVGTATSVGVGAAAAGSAALAAICWVARAVYGPSDKRWRIFRVWLLIEAPRALKELYREQGEGIAQSLYKFPHIKAALRAIMDKVVAV